MKKIFVIPAILALLSFCSCNKNWICSCKDLRSGNVQSQTMYHMTRAQAATLCVASNDPNTVCGL